jgi:hypothetical protein
MGNILSLNFRLSSSNMEEEGFIVGQRLLRKAEPDLRNGSLPYSSADSLNFVMIFSEK